MSPKNKTTKRDNHEQQSTTTTTTTTTNATTTTTDITTTNATNNNEIATPPIIKINRKYSRLSLNSSYESLPDSRSCSSAANTTPSRSR